MRKYSLDPEVASIGLNWCEIIDRLVNALRPTNLVRWSQHRLGDDLLLVMQLLVDPTERYLMNVQDYQRHCNKGSMLQALESLPPGVGPRKMTVRNRSH